MTSTNWIRGQTLVADDLDLAFGRCIDRAGDTMGGTLTLHADPTSALQSATKQYVDNAIINAIPSISSSFLPLSGGTMTGPLVMAANSTAPTPVTTDSTTKIATTAFVK